MVGGAEVVRGRRLRRSWYRRDSLDVAAGLLNTVLVTDDGRAGRVVEVEAYRGEDDPGSHAYGGRSARNATMWGPPGHLYVYFTYGMHWCANVVCATEGVAQAVLLRAVAPEAGVDAMRAARRVRSPSVAERDLCRGPARLCQAMSIGPGHDGADLVTAAGGVWLVDDGTPAPASPGVGPRVGLSAGGDLPWRFWVPGHPGVSTWRPGRRRGPARGPSG